MSRVSLYDNHCAIAFDKDLQAGGMLAGATSQWTAKSQTR